MGRTKTSGLRCSVRTIPVGGIQLCGGRQEEECWRSLAPTSRRAFLSEPDHNAQSFEETALTLYITGFSGPDVAEVMHTTIGRVYYHLGKVRRRRGLRWLRELRG
jgi:hypothetical protein